MAEAFSMRAAKTPMERIESILIISTLLLLVAVTVQPLLNPLALSLSDPSKVPGFSGLSIIPDGLSLDVWTLLLQHPYVQRGIFNSIWMTATSVASVTPPTTGSTQPAMPRLVRTSILTVKTPKKRQPSAEWSRTRVVWC